jgi:hypothetical protein
LLQSFEIAVIAGFVVSMFFSLIVKLAVQHYLTEGSLG